jgi:hypothetical protein
MALYPKNRNRMILERRVRRWIAEFRLEALEPGLVAGVHEALEGGAEPAAVRAGVLRRLGPANARENVAAWLGSLMDGRDDPAVRGSGEADDDDDDDQAGFDAADFDSVSQRAAADSVSVCGEEPAACSNRTVPTPRSPFNREW